MDVRQSLDGEAYAQASRHQKSWGEALLEDLTLRGMERVLDLGCGDGVVTSRLAERLPHGSVVGIDKSASMIAKAQQLHGPNLAFLVMDMEQLVFDGGFDVIFSNAAVHWVRDQARLLRPGGEGDTRRALPGGTRAGRPAPKGYHAIKPNSAMEPDAKAPLAR